MITYSQLGYYGRLGNQMFQYAALVGIADKVGCPYGINYKNSQAKKIPNSLIPEEKLDLIEAFDLSAEDISDQPEAKNFYEEKSFNFNPSVFDLNPNTDILGYFQTEKYFEHCVDKIRTEFKFKPHIEEEAKSQIDQLRDGKQLVSLHVRRGDYIQQQNYHPLCTVEYYKKATSLFKNVKFIVFSDDIAWCQKHLVGDNFFYITGNNQFVDMCMMSLCDRHIIANSSFSWWGAWLNPSPDKQVIAPRKWFGLFFEQTTKELYCKDWIVIGTWPETFEVYLSRLWFKMGGRRLVEYCLYISKYPNKLVPSIQAKLFKLFSQS